MKTLRKKFFRDLKETKARVLVSIIIIMVGTSAYIIMEQSYLNLLGSYEKTYEDLSLADLWITTEPIQDDFQNAKISEILEDLPEVSSLEPRLSIAGKLEIDNKIIKGQFIGINASSPNNLKVNKLRVEGEYFTESVIERVIQNGRVPVIAEHHLKIDNHVGTGDILKVTFSRNTPNGTIQSTMEVEVIGTAISPEFLLISSNPDLILPSKGSFGILFFHLNVLQNITNMEGLVNEYVLKTPDIRDVKKSLESDPNLSHFRSNLISVAERDDLYSYKGLNQDLDMFHVITPLTTMIVFLVAGLSISISLHRLVTSHRMEIGVLRSQGWMRKGVMRYYLAYVMIIAAIGTVLGIVIGIWGAVELTDYYISIFHIPVTRTGFELNALIPALIMGMIVPLLFGLRAAFKASSLSPVESMHPRAIKTPSKWLSRVTAPLSFMVKYPIRNITRSKMRAFTTVVAIAGSIVLAMSMAGMMSAMYHGIDSQFKDVELWDYMVTFDGAKDQHVVEADLGSISGVNGVDPYLGYHCKIQGKYYKLIGLSNNSFHKFGGKGWGQGGFLGPDSIIVDQFIVDTLNLEFGSKVEVTILSKMFEFVAVERTSEIMQGVAYIPLRTLQEIVAESDFITTEIPVNGAYVKGIGLEELIKRSDAPSYFIEVLAKDQMEKDFRALLEEFTPFIDVFYIIGLVVSVSVVLNTVTLNLTDREIELGTLKTLGSSNSLLARGILYENLFLGIVAGILGVVLGRYTSFYLMDEISGEFFYLQHYLDPIIFPSFFGMVFIIMGITTIPAWLYIIRMDVDEVVKNINR
ncbi:MAG: FtsX-like permease family protein [Thermoplasmata archaeon]|nr:MAG: FtsX-like permease family protein [Thermoplasmata archaeon]